MHFECELDFVHMLPGTLALGLLARQFNSVVISIRAIQTFEHLHGPAIFIVSHP